MSLSCVVLVLLFALPSNAFGAGNIGSTSKIEGQNWRHGDIEDTLLTLLLSLAAGDMKFSKLDVKRACSPLPYRRLKKLLNNLTRSILVNGCAIVLKRMTSAQSSMCQQKPFVSCYRYWVCSHPDMARKNSKSQRKDWAATDPRSVSLLLNTRLQSRSPSCFVLPTGACLATSTQGSKTRTRPFNARDISGTMMTTFVLALVMQLQYFML